MSTGVILLANDAVAKIASDKLDVTVQVGQQEYVLSAGTGQNQQVQSGGIVSALHSGIVKGGMIESGGAVYVQKSGRISGTSVFSGGIVIVSSANATGLQLIGGIVSADHSDITSTVISAGGTLTDAGGNDHDTNIYAGGSESIYNDDYYGNYSSTRSISAVIYSGATQSILGDAQSQDTQIQSGGELFAQSGSDIENAMISAGGTIDLFDFSFVSGGTVTLQSDVLKITEGKSSTSLTLAGSYTAAQFHLAADLNGGTLLTLSAAQSLGPIALIADAIPATAAPAAMDRADRSDHAWSPEGPKVLQQTDHSFDSLFIQTP